MTAVSTASSNGARSAAISDVLVARTLDDAARAARIAAVGGELRRALLEHARARQDELRAVFAEGLVPSFIDLAGASDLEKPFNSLVGWWADEHGSHCCGRRFLSALADRVGPPELAADLRAGEPVDVVVERAVLDEQREPDLMLRSPKGALLVENKVHAGESGPGQYADYLSTLRRWGDGRACRAVLAVRSAREKPPDWDELLLHRDLAALFDALSTDETAPTWGRIAATITTHTLRATHDESLVRRARALLEKQQLTVADAHAIEALLAQSKPVTSPWSRR